MNRRAFLALTLTAVGLKLGPRPSKWITPAPSALPSGYIMPHVRSPRVPPGWLVCDGRVLRKRDYPELAKVIGRAYGSVGVDTFRVPDLRARINMHLPEAGVSKPPERFIIRDWVIKA